MRSGNSDNILDRPPDIRRPPLNEHKTSRNYKKGTRGQDVNITTDHVKQLLFLLTNQILLFCAC